MRDRVFRWRWELFLSAILLAVFFVNISLSPFYLGEQNFVNMFQLSIEKVIVVVVMTFVIINGEIDLSVASVMGFSACVLAGLARRGWSSVRGGGRDRRPRRDRRAGLLQGSFIAFMGLPSLVVTLAGLIGFRGAARIIVEDNAIGDFPDVVRPPRPGPARRPLLAGVHPLPRRDRPGRDHPAQDGVRAFRLRDRQQRERRALLGHQRRPRQAHHHDRVRHVAGLAGVLFAARLGTVRGDLATGFELDIITMVLLGGVSIFGGSGTIVGVGLSILIVLNIRNGLGLANYDQNTQLGVIGALLILSVLVPNLVGRLASAPARGSDRMRGRHPPPGRARGR